MRIEVKYYALKHCLSFVFSLPQHNLVSLKTYHTLTEILSVLPVLETTELEKACVIIPMYLPKVPFGLLAKLFYLYLYIFYIYIQY